MIHRGVASFGLDGGHCPPWLFERMVKLGRAMVEVLIDEYGPNEFVRRIADPAWFQSLGTVLAFDWNASGLTTILTAALKEAIRGEEANLGIFICGGKGKTSRKTPDEILRWGERLALPESQADRLVYNSKMSAKVDSAMVQDGFQLYHHSFFFALDRSSGRNTLGSWAVVQQGMNADARKARRYHWHSENITDLVAEPHSGITPGKYIKNVLDLTSRKSSQARDISTELVQAGYGTLMKDIQLIRKFSSRLNQSALFETMEGQRIALLNLESREFKHHPVAMEDFSRSKYLEKVLARMTDVKPKSYESLVAQAGVGPKTLRALALVAEVVYGAKPSYEDPARYSFAHGGKDGTPYFVDRPTYDETIAVLGAAVRKARIPAQDKQEALGRLESSSRK